MCIRDSLCSDRIGAPAACANLSATRAFHSVHTAGVLWVHSAFFVPDDLDLWPWHSNSSARGTKHVFRVNLAQIRSALPAIRCQMRVSRIDRVSTISYVWYINGRQSITVNSGVSRSKFTKFLYDVDRTSVLLTRPSAFPCCHPKKEGVSSISADFASKIGCHGNVPWPIQKPIPDWTSAPARLAPPKIWWRSVLYSFWDLFAPSDR